MAISIDLSEKVAIVTGAGRGIGRAVALGLAEAGADICVTARTAAEIEETARLVRNCGRKVLALPGDATQSAVAAEVVGRTIGELVGLHILVTTPAWSCPRHCLTRPRTNMTG